MDRLVNLNLPFPPSLNQLWRFGRGNWYLTQKARQYKAFVYDAIILAKPIKIKKDQLLMMDIEAYPPDNRNRDIDNLLKIILDSLQDAQVYVNDSQIKELTIKMMNKVNKGQMAYVNVSIYPLDDKYKS